MHDYKFIVVGAGFFGATIAERIANDLHQQVLVIDKRRHLGGNSFSKIDSQTNIEEHVYGSHIFHTSLIPVWQYINRFSKFTNYQHNVFTQHAGKVYPLPINLQTINAFYGKQFNPQEAQTFITAEIKKDKIAQPKNLEEKAISLIGRKLYNAFIKEYTQKQWGTDPKQLPEDIITRLPVRFNYNNNYFSDIWQGLPLDGYFSIFECMFKSSPLITVELGVSFEDIRRHIPSQCTVIYTGPIDAFFDFKFGRLGWRTIEFKRELLSLNDYQGCPVMNYADSYIPYTRQHEFKHYHPERPCTAGTIIYSEYSRFCQPEEDPYYPINTVQDQQILTKYQESAALLPNYIFGGRLGEYKYYDMDKAISAALDTYQTKIKNRV